MRYALIMMVAAFAIAAADANATLMVTHSCSTITCVNSRQLQNLKHAKYVCNNGAHYNKRWNCAAVKWLTREYDETEAVLHPPMMQVASTSGYTARCGRSCVSCETGGTFNPQIVSPSGTYWGWYQFDYQTWVGAGGIPSHYGHASAGEQTTIAARLDYDAWPNC